jgi:hypothetical protein
MLHICPSEDHEFNNGCLMDKWKALLIVKGVLRTDHKYHVMKKKNCYGLMRPFNIDTNYV